MNQGKYVFTQIAEFLPQRVFTNKYVKHFSCLNQLHCMIFGQLTNRDSLRDLLTINAHSGKSYHLGFGKNVTRSNLDLETDRTFFLTNNFEISAEQVAFLFKNRWKIELFFLSLNNPNTSKTNREFEYDAKVKSKYINRIN